jgi:hypothetical protein
MRRIGGKKLRLTNNTIYAALLGCQDRFNGGNEATTILKCKSAVHDFLIKCVNTVVSPSPHVLHVVYFFPKQRSWNELRKGKKGQGVAHRVADSAFRGEEGNSYTLAQTRTG